MQESAFHGWFRAGDGELAAKVTFDDQTRLIEAHFLEQLRPQQPTAALLIRKLLSWYEAGVDQADIIEFCGDNAEQTIIPFAIEDEDKTAATSNEEIELLEITRGGAEGVLAIFIVKGERRCYEAAGVETLANTHAQHHDAAHWRRVAERMRDGYYLNLAPSAQP